jgi:hypothetical protein
LKRTPPAAPEEADPIGVVRAVGEVEDHDDIVALATAVPAMERDDLVVVIDVMDVGVVPP